MAQVVVTFKLMMESPEVDIDAVKVKAKEALEKIDIEIGKDEIEPVAFGIKALILTVVADESKGTDDMENLLDELEGVSSAKVIDYRRALG